MFFLMKIKLRFQERNCAYYLISRWHILIPMYSLKLLINFRIIYTPFMKVFKILSMLAVILCTCILFNDTTSQDRDLNILWNCLYRPIWLNILVAQWLKHRACEPHIPSSNSQVFFFSYMLNQIFENHSLSKNICLFLSIWRDKAPKWL